MSDSILGGEPQPKVSRNGRCGVPCNLRAAQIAKKEYFLATTFLGSDGAFYQVPTMGWRILSPTYRRCSLFWSLRGPGPAKMLPKPFPRTVSTDARCMMRALETAQMPPKEYPAECLAGLRTEGPAQGCSFVCVSFSLRILCDCGSFFGLAHIFLNTHTHVYSICMSINVLYM